MNGLFEKYMAECPLIAILRGITPAEVPSVCDALFSAGIRLLEIPLNSPDAFTGIAEAVRHTEGRQIAGAGTDAIYAVGRDGRLERRAAALVARLIHDGDEFLRRGGEQVG